MKTNIKRIRNFSIIAHIDHGKSTLADRMIQLTGTVKKHDMKDRLLDTLELEQEKGITIKLQTVRMIYTYNGSASEFSGDYILNLIDTPGHVDFSYEVSRSLAASECAVLVVDATQGIQAQTITTIYKAFEFGLPIIPVINKIDLPTARIEDTISEMVSTFGFSSDEILQTSGKSGIGVDELLSAIVERCPEPKIADGFRAMIFDSFYHEYKGVIALIKIASGNLKKGQVIKFFRSQKIIEPIEFGYLSPNLAPQDEIGMGEVAYIATGLKTIKDVHVGDTVLLNGSDLQPLPGYQVAKPMVYASLYPVEADGFEDFSDALEKLALNDASLSYKKEYSQALGSGFMCGFLGLLHLEITIERLSREFDINLISTTPSVEYRVHLTTDNQARLSNVNPANIDGKLLTIHKSAEFPDPTLIEYIEEPWVSLEIIAPDQYIGAIMELCTKHRAIYKTMEYVVKNDLITSKKHVILRYLIPTGEIITNFFDTLKSITKGYASMDYEFKEYRRSDIVKVNILINQDIVEALSFLTHKLNAEYRGRKLTEKLKDIIPRQNFKVPIQAAIGGKVIARETIPAFRKDVIAKLYGGDITRKMKLLNKQKKGKKRLKTFGKVEIPKEAFLAVLKD